MVKNQKNKKEIATFLEKKINELNERIKKDQAAISPLSKRVLSDLYLQLAQIKEISGVKKDELVELYKNAVFSSEGGTANTVRNKSFKISSPQKTFK